MTNPLAATCCGLHIPALRLSGNPLLNQRNSFGLALKLIFAMHVSKDGKIIEALYVYPREFSQSLNETSVTNSASVARLGGC